MNSQTQKNEPPYRGSPKHKNRPSEGMKGTLCPEWTHEVPGQRLGNNIDSHNWPATKAAELFVGATIDEQTGRRYATDRGIAFEAKPTNDGTWHGYPIPWESVPASIKDTWIAKGKTTSRSVKKFFRFDKSDIHWPLRTDT